MTKNKLTKKTNNIKNNKKRDLGLIGYGCNNIGVNMSKTKSNGNIKVNYQII